MTFFPDNYPDAKAEKLRLEAIVDSTCKVMEQFPRGNMGLTTDEARSTPQWQAAYRAKDQAMSALRNFNSIFVKRFKREYAEDRKRKYSLVSQ